MTTTEGFSDPQPETNAGIPRKWVVSLRSGQQLLVRFTDEAESEIEVAIRGNEWATWSPGYPGVPA